MSQLNFKFFVFLRVSRAFLQFELLDLDYIHCMLNAFFIRNVSFHTIGFKQVCVYILTWRQSHIININAKKCQFWSVRAFFPFFLYTFGYMYFFFKKKKVRIAVSPTMHFKREIPLHYTEYILVSNVKMHFHWVYRKFNGSTQFSHWRAIFVSFW